MKGCLKMGLVLPAINLTMGKAAFPYQDVMWMNPGFVHAPYSIPSIRGSQSDNSGI